MSDGDLHDPLRALRPSAREHLRRVLIRDHADRDAIAMQLLRYPDENGQGWADIIDFLTMHPDVRRQIVRLIAEFSTGEAQTDVDTMSREVQVSRTRRTANAG